MFWAWISVQSKFLDFVSKMSLHKSNSVNLKRVSQIVEEVIPGFTQITQLHRTVDVEEKLDGILKRRLAILQEQKSVSFNDKSKARIRVKVSATFEIETPGLITLGAGELGVPASGTMLLKVTGSRIDSQVQKADVPLFTSYFDKVGARISGVDFPRPISPTWDRFCEAEKNGLHVKLKTLGPINVEVYVKPKYPLYELKDRLLLIPGNQRVDTFENVIANIWGHVKRLKLQDPADCRLIRCDTLLQAALGARLIAFGQLRERLLSLMKKHDYIAREFTFGYDWESLEHQKSFEFEVGLSSEMNYGSSGVDALRRKMTKDDDQIKVLDKRMRLMSNELSESIKKCKLYNVFHERPMEFLKNWMVSQEHDLKVVDNALLGEKYGSAFSITHRRSEFYKNAPEICHAVSMYLDEKCGNERRSNF